MMYIIEIYLWDSGHKVHKETFVQDRPGADSGGGGVRRLAPWVSIFFIINLVIWI